MDRKLRYTKNFSDEFSKLSINLKEDFIILVGKYLKGERLPSNLFKTFKLDKQIKIQEFKLKDSQGNWRAISFLEGEEAITFIYAFHKKSQKLLHKDKKIIIKRIKELT
jgi:phage-related protein